MSETRKIIIGTESNDYQTLLTKKLQHYNEWLNDHEIGEPPYPGYSETSLAKNKPEKKLSYYMRKKLENANKR